MIRAAHQLWQRWEALNRAFQVGRDVYVRKPTQASPRLEPDRLSEICGVKSPEAIALLHEHQSRPECLAALMLVPVLLVAWADQKIVEWERGEILDAAEAAGIRCATPAFQLLGQWLDHRPEKELHDTWMQYVRALCRELDPIDRARLAERVLRPARLVAESTSGVLGSRFRPWRREQRVLRDLATAFET